MEEVKKQGMESLFCPYDLALELKELGFNEGVLAQYRVDGYLCWGKDDCSLGSDISDEDYKNNCFPEFGCRAPLWQQAFDWFREKNYMEGHLYISYNLLPKATWGYSIQTSEPKYIKSLNSHYSTYEEARQACLEKLIEIAKEQNVK